MLLKLKYFYLIFKVIFVQSTFASLEFKPASTILDKFGDALEYLNTPN